MCRNLARLGHECATSLKQHPDDADQKKNQEVISTDAGKQRHQPSFCLVSYCRGTNGHVRASAVRATGARRTDHDAVGTDRPAAMAAREQSRPLGVAVAEHFTLGGRLGRGDQGHLDAAPGTEAGVFFVLFSAARTGHVALF